MNQNLAGKQILMVIAPERFRDEELFEPKAVFEQAGATVTIAASRLGEATGMLGGRCEPDVLLTDVRAKDYDAVIVVGGSGLPEYPWPDAALQRLVKHAVERHCVVGAICLAGVVLARAGVLAERKATVYRNDDALREYKQAQVNYSKQDVVIDGRIVTASDLRVAGPAWLGELNPKRN